MMGEIPHEPEHEAVLERVVVGEITAVDPQVQRLREQCSQCRQDLAELVGILVALDSDAGQWDSSSSDAPADSPGSTQVQDSWRELTRERNQSRMWLPMAALLLLGISLWLALAGSPDDPPPREEMVLSGVVSIDSVVWDGLRGFEVRWSGELPPGGSYRVEIRDDARPAAEALRVIRDLEEPWVQVEWERADEIPARLRITVVIRGPFRDRFRGHRVEPRPAD